MDDILARCLQDYKQALPVECDRKPGVTERQRRVDQLIASADRYDSFAEIAELMGDEAGADRFRSFATRRRLAAMTLLDESG